jgi:hypothetical protein
MVVEVVEADLAAGEDFGLREEVVEFGIGGLMGKAGFMGMDAGAGPDSGDLRSSRVFAADIEGAMHGVGTLSNADREDLVNAGGVGALKQGGSVFVVARAVEVGVGIDHR